MLATVTLDRGAFACALSRRHDPRLFVVGQIFGGPEPAQPSGQVVVVPGARAGSQEALTSGFGGSRGLTGKSRGRGGTWSTPDVR